MEKSLDEIKARSNESFLDPQAIHIAKVANSPTVACETYETLYSRKRSIAMACRYLAIIK